MYCDPADAGRRRATQTAMHEIFDALCKLLAPILAFTADEAWRYSSPGGSIHLQEFPPPRRTPPRTGYAPEGSAAEAGPAQDRHGDASVQVAELLKLRSIIGQAIERARQDKLIGNALEAAVVLNSNSDVTTRIDKEELEEFFILSDLTVHQTQEAGASVTKTSYKKCARCWRHRPTVGASAAHPDLCDRCEAVVTALEGRAPASP